MTAPREKACANCRQPIRITEIDGEQVITDPERITIVPDTRGRDKQVLTAYRLHGESCERYKRDAEKAKLREEQRAWEQKQQAKGSGSGRGDFVVFTADEVKRSTSARRSRR